MKLNANGMQLKSGAMKIQFDGLLRLFKEKYVNSGNNAAVFLDMRKNHAGTKKIDRKNGVIDHQFFNPHPSRGLKFCFICTSNHYRQKTILEEFIPVLAVYSKKDILKSKICLSYDDNTAQRKVLRPNDCKGTILEYSVPLVLTQKINPVALFVGDPNGYQGSYTKNKFTRILNALAAKHKCPVHHIADIQMFINAGHAWSGEQARSMAGFLIMKTMLIGTKVH